VCEHVGGIEKAPTELWEASTRDKDTTGWVNYLDDKVTVQLRSSRLPPTVDKASALAPLRIGSASHDPKSPVRILTEIQELRLGRLRTFRLGPRSRKPLRVAFDMRYETPI